MSWNIERGFHSRNHVLEEHRLHAAQRVVGNVKPDILALTEACYGGPNSQEITMNYRSLFDFPYGKFGGYPFFGPGRSNEGGNYLLSRFPMQAQSFPLAHKGAVRAQIPLEDQALTIDVIHPSPGRSDEEKIAVLQPLISSRQEPYILTGDFNTVHPDDRYRYDWEKIKSDLISYDPEKAGLILNNWKKAKLVSWLLELGLKDAFPLEARTSTAPTNYAYGSPREGVRMDFMFISPGISVRDAYVVKNKDTEMASDHYPIVGILEVD
ncbi:endonuclease/exonuclease/phosphatase family protein [Candidatus Woesearchaeota archaeon]|nr:endonuclease/exonuclease/phosphatase family protein [Candidatus Woesearchaeota archaeon]